jgi:hypothetical protein
MVVALFGEAERGEFRMPIHLKSLPDLMEKLGEPPPESLGLPYAIQSLLYDHELLFFRVEEEGFSTEDYLDGLTYLRADFQGPSLSAICLPGVGDTHLIEASAPVCQRHRSLLLLTESDLYDYLTAIQ